jgi:hypothetical protein
LHILRIDLAVCSLIRNINVSDFLFSLIFQKYRLFDESTSNYYRSMMFIAREMTLLRNLVKSRNTHFRLFCVYMTDLKFYAKSHYSLTTFREPISLI